MVQGLSKNIKKRQHYVWKDYLRAWAEEEYIWTFFKESNKIGRPNLVGIAQEKFFYKLPYLTVEEEILTKELILSFCDIPEVKSAINGFYDIFISPSQIRRSFQALGIDDIQKKSLLKTLESNMLEDLHTRMENKGKKLLNCNSVTDIEDLYKDNSYVDALIFICFQYIRTRKMKDAILIAVKGKANESLFEKSWSIISIAFALTLSFRFTVAEHIKFTFIKNQTEIPFITSDQPAFNLVHNLLDERGNVKDFELYFPLSPYAAIILYFDPSQKEKFIGEKANKELVELMNKRMFDYSSQFVFSMHENQLPIN